jgi:Helix-turn-helix domain
MEQAETEISILNEYLTKAELAAQLHRSIRSVDRWALSGDGPPYIRIGRRTLYRRAAVIEWLRGLEMAPGRVGQKRRRGASAREN